MPGTSGAAVPGTATRRAPDSRAADAGRPRERRPADGRPRLAFIGLGWIGLDRLRAVAGSGAAVIGVVADPAADARERARLVVPGIRLARSLEEALDDGPDGLVIATPTALHAEQALAALERGVAVFCQKPLGRDAAETRAAVRAAAAADRPLGVDLSYRFTRGMNAIRRLVRDGSLGRIYAGEFAFHNAYGPDRAWFYDSARSGGGCVIDLGIHLVDLALWCLDFPAVERVASRLFARGEPFAGGDDVEDYATARLDLAGGAAINVSCSWGLHAGCDAEIRASLFGRDGGATFRNIDGSFYDFEAHHHTGTGTVRLAQPPDDWSGRAAVDWTRRLASGSGYDPGIERIIDVAATLDRIYGR